MKGSVQTYDLSHGNISELDWCVNPDLAYCLLVLHLRSFLSFSALVHAGDLYSPMSKLLGQNNNVAHIHKYSPSKMRSVQAELMSQIDSLMQKKDVGFPTVAFHTREDQVLVRDRVHKFHQLGATAKPPRSKLLAEGWSWKLIFYWCWCWKHPPCFLCAFQFINCIIKYSIRQYEYHPFSFLECILLWNYFKICIFKLLVIIK